MRCTAEVYQLPLDRHGGGQCTLLTARKQVLSSDAVIRHLIDGGTITGPGDFLVIMDDVANRQRRVYQHRVREVVERRLVVG